MGNEGLRQPLGPLVVDIKGTSLDDEERRMLCHPLVGGVILFARNFSSPAQLRELCAELHALRDPALITAVDHEGGRVQRFRDGFTAVPSMRTIGRLFEANAAEARRAAWAAGLVIACELRAHGVDLSFAPVLDLEYGASSVIGDRALHADPGAVADLAGELIRGLAEAGMPGVGKHFPGHGFISADSHVAVPVDARSLEDIMSSDVVPYRALAHRLGGVMPAHVIFDHCDPSPAGFSEFWLKRILRERLGFGGVVFSDDLSMEGASVAGGMSERATAALSAGCDMLLVCNAFEDARRLLSDLKIRWDPGSAARVQKLAAMRDAVGPADVGRERLSGAREVVSGLVPAQPEGRGCEG